MIEGGAEGWPGGGRLGGSLSTCYRRKTAANKPRIAVITTYKTIVLLRSLIMGYGDYSLKKHSLNAMNLYH